MIGYSPGRMIPFVGVVNAACPGDKNPNRSPAWWGAIPFSLAAALLFTPSDIWATELKKPDGASAGRIDPADIVGSLILTGPAAELPDEAIERFVALAGKTRKAPVLVVVSETRMNRWSKRMPGDPASWKSIAPTERRAFVAEALKAQAVWLDLSAEEADQFFAVDSVAEALSEILRRGGTLGLSDAASLHAGKAHSLPGAGKIRLLPDAQVVVSGMKIEQEPGQVRYLLEKGAALEIAGRTLRAIGHRPVYIRLAPSKSRPAREIVLKGKAAEDLVALRRAARQRTVPDPAPGIPVVEKGALVIVGGGGYPSGLMDRFVQLAGGKKSSIVILPTANPDPLPKGTGLEDLFRKAGAAKVKTLPGRTLAEVDGEDSLAALRSATGIWFGGGRQWRFVDAYEGTKALERMKDVLRSGGVIGGTSAGATIQGEYLCRGGVFENFTMMYEGYERGLGFLPGVAIDQHFSQRKRFGDMSELMKKRPDLLGIGIDETTAIIVQGSVAEVTGKGSAYFFNAPASRDDGDADHEQVASGGQYDLKMRKRLK